MVLTTIDNAVNYMRYIGECCGKPRNRAATISCVSGWNQRRTALARVATDGIKPGRVIRMPREAAGAEDNRGMRELARVAGGHPGTEPAAAPGAARTG